MMSKKAAERRKSVATAEGRGNERQEVVSRVAAKDSFAATRLMRWKTLTTAFGRGYVLTPLRGFLASALLLSSSAYGQSPQLTLDRVVDMYMERNLELQAARYRLERTKADQIA